MHALMISKDPNKLTKLIDGFRKVNITLEAIEPEKIGRLWLTQYHLAQIHPSINTDECLNIMKAIRNLNFEIPIIHSSTSKEEIIKTIPIPSNISEKDLIQIYRATVHKNRKEEKLKYKELTLDINTKTIRRKRRAHKLSNREFGLMHLLISNCEKVISKFEIFESLWDRNGYINSNFIEVHISNLRKKVDQGFKKKLIHTIPHHGYILKE